MTIVKIVLLFACCTRSIHSCTCILNNNLKWKLLQKIYEGKVWERKKHIPFIYSLCRTKMSSNWSIFRHHVNSWPKVGVCWSKYLLIGLLLLLCKRLITWLLHRMCCATMMIINCFLYNRWKAIFVCFWEHDICRWTIGTFWNQNYIRTVNRKSRSVVASWAKTSGWPNLGSTRFDV